MPVDYVQVLADLDAEIAAHKKDMEELQAARPAIVALRNKLNPLSKQLPFAGVGATAAIRTLLSVTAEWHTALAIQAHLTEKGWTTDSPEPGRVIASTLSQMKANGFVEKRDDMWRWLAIRNVPVGVQAATSESELLSLQ